MSMESRFELATNGPSPETSLQWYERKSKIRESEEPIHDLKGPVHWKISTSLQKIVDNAEVRNVLEVVRGRLESALSGPGDRHDRPKSLFKIHTH